VSKERLSGGGVVVGSTAANVAQEEINGSGEEEDGSKAGIGDPIAVAARDTLDYGVQAQAAMPVGCRAAPVWGAAEKAGEMVAAPRAHRRSPRHDSLRRYPASGLSKELIRIILEVPC
jgi:hypothetical protein